MPAKKKKPKASINNATANNNSTAAAGNVAAETTVSSDHKASPASAKAQTDEQLFSEFKLQMEAGDVVVLNNLGCLYVKKPDLENQQKGFSCFVKAAKRGYLQAKTNLAYCHLAGIGTKKNPALAIPLLQEAADVGIAHAQVQIGLCRARGVSLPISKLLPENNPQALEYFRKAADSHYLPAQYYFGVVKYLQSSDMKYLARMLADEKFREGMLKSKAEAILSIRKAAKRGFLEAQYRMGFLFDTPNSGIEHDVVQTIILREAAESKATVKENAIYWHQQAADVGYVPCKFQVAKCHLYGTSGLQANKAHAIDLLTPLALEGYSEATELLTELKIDNPNFKKNKEIESYLSDVTNTLIDLQKDTVFAIQPMSIKTATHKSKKKTSAIANSVGAKAADKAKEKETNTNAASATAPAPEEKMPATKQACLDLIDNYLNDIVGEKKQTDETTVQKIIGVFLQLKKLHQSVSDGKNVDTLQSFQMCSPVVAFQITGPNLEKHVKKLILDITSCWYAGCRCEVAMAGEGVVINLPDNPSKKIARSFMASVPALIGATIARQTVMAASAVSAASSISPPSATASTQTTTNIVSLTQSL